MTTKSLILAGALGLATFGIASAKSYDIILSDPTMAGATQLHAGEYKLKVEGSDAVFTDVQNQQTFKAPVKVENSKQRFGDTRVETTKTGEMAHIDSIDLAGSTTKLEFGR